MNEKARLMKPDSYTKVIALAVSVRKHARQAFILALILIALSACGEPNPLDPTMPPVSTTIIVTDSQPTATLTNDFTNTPTRQSPTVDSPTREAPLPFVTVKTNANIRNGPGIDCSPITTLSEGVQARIVGRDNAGTWWLIELDGGSRTGWIGAQVVVLEGDTSAVPIVSAPVCSPTIEDDGEGESTFKIFDVYDCTYIGNSKYEWYKVEIEYVDDHPVAERILEGPFQGPWQPNCPPIPPVPPTETPCGGYGCGNMVVPGIKKLIGAFIWLSVGATLGLALVYWRTGDPEDS